ncbi:MAG: hypothetical protein AABX37_02970, partial [Nanoarchaeota archaeon]
MSKSKRFFPLETLVNIPSAPPGRGLYPSDITEEEFQQLGDDALKVNSSVVRSDDGMLYVVHHEARFRQELIPVRQSLANAYNFSSDERLKEYIKAKIEELKEGTAAQREQSNLRWLVNEGRIDFSLGTGIETYFDRFKGVRGIAEGEVYVVRDDFRELCEGIMALLPEFEATAPWQHKKEVDGKNMPRLRFADVVTWSGFMDFFPHTVMAHSLPNEKEFRDRYGSVNVIFANVQEAIVRGGFGKYIQKEFFPNAEMALYGNLLASMHLKLTAAHEIGHTTGGMVIEQDPTEYFGTEYSRLEEGRAEVFSLWTLPRLIR